MPNEKPEYVNLKNEIHIKNSWWAVSILIILIIVTFINASTNKTEARLALQRMADEDDQVNKLKITSVYMPAWSGIPGLGLLSSIGLAPRTIDGSFMIERKDGSQISGRCGTQDYEFSRVRTANDDQGTRVAGSEVFRLRACASAH